MQFHALYPLEDHTEINCKLKACSRAYPRTFVEACLLEDHRELYKRDIHVLFYICNLKKSLIMPDNWLTKVSNKFPRPKIVHGVKKYYWYTWIKDDGKQIFSRWKPFNGSCEGLSESLIWKIKDRRDVKKNK